MYISIMKSKSKKESILHRVKIVKGHILAIERMIEEDRYCIDIIHQSLAVQKALKNLDMEIMTDHLKTCVVEQAKEGKEQKLVDELVNIYKYK